MTEGKKIPSRPKSMSREEWRAWKRRRKRDWKELGRDEDFQYRVNPKRVTDRTLSLNAERAKQKHGEGKAGKKERDGSINPGTWGG